MRMQELNDTMEATKNSDPQACIAALREMIATVKAATAGGHPAIDLGTWDSDRYGYDA